jgi:ABC-type antimicrobial peptide transport system permease subunit
MISLLLLIAAAILLTLTMVGKVPLSYNLRNLTIRWKTTLLTALAFTAVIALLTVMMAFVNGMRRLTDQTGQPGNVLVLADGATDEAFSNLSGGDLGEIENLPAVVRNNGRPMSSRETFLIVNQRIPNPANGRPKRRFVQVRGVENPQLTSRVHNMGILPGGHWFSEAGVQEADEPSAAPRIQAVLGQGAALALALDRTPQQLAAAKNRDRLEVGDTFALGNRMWIVVGVLDSADSTFNSEIWAKRSLVASLFGKNTYTTLVLRTKDAAAANHFKEYLNNNYKKAAVVAHVETDYYANMSETTAQFSYAIGFIAVIMSVGGIFGVMNTMFAAISQRTGDIGVLRLLGYARWHVLVSFLLESLAIALAGGLLGCAIGSLTDGWTATSIVGSHGGGGKSIVLELAVSRDTIAVGILLTLLMGLLGGLLPALSAMRMKPLEALR